MSDQERDPALPPVPPVPSAGASDALVPSRPALSPSLPPVPIPHGMSRPARHRVNQALETMEEALGGRDGLVDALALGVHGTVDRARAEYVLGLIADPKHARRSLRQIAKVSGITLDELLSLYRDAVIMRAHLASISKVAAGLPGVVADVMAKSVPYEDTCYGCSGTGSITPEPTKKQSNPCPEPCTVCRGAGRLLHQPDLERQKLALTLGGLIKGGGAGTTVNILQQQANVPPGQVPYTAGDALVGLQKMSDAALYGDRSMVDRAIDAELADDTAGPEPGPADG